MAMKAMNYAWIYDKPIGVTNIFSYHTEEVVDYSIYTTGLINR